MRLMPLWEPACEFNHHLISTQELLTSPFRIVFGIIYWYFWTVLIPRWRGYRLEEEKEVLSDGTSITKLVHVS